MNEITSYEAITLPGLQFSLFVGQQRGRCLERRLVDKAPALFV